MLIDNHTHIFKYPGHLSDEHVKEARGTSPGAMESNPNVDTEKFIADMKDVHKAFLLGFQSEGIFVPNDFVSECVERYPNKLIGFCSVNPNDQGAVMELERSIRDLGLRGLKLAPIYQRCDPNGPEADAVFQKAAELKIPIIIHQGTTFVRNAPLKYANPILLEDVAIKYPDLKMVIAHLGHPWDRETIVLIRKQPNLYADISALYYRPWQFYNSMILAMEYGVTHKLLFGSDYPATTPRDAIEGIYNINHVVAGSKLPKIPKNVLSDIIFRDTLGLLGLE